MVEIHIYLQSQCFHIYHCLQYLDACYSIYTAFYLTPFTQSDGKGLWLCKTTVDVVG
jgi:hypothetical protein